MDTLEKLKQKITEFEARSAAKDEIKSFTTLLLQVLKASKESFDSLTEDNLKTIKEAIAYIEQEHSKTLETVNRETTTTKQEFAKQLKEVKDLVAKVKTIKPVDGIDGQDGYTPVKGQDYFTDKDIKDIKDSVLEDIPEQTGEEIVEKINALPTDDADKKIDASHIKNLPEQVRYYAGNSGIKEIIAGTNITVDNSNLGYPVISATGVGSSIDLEVEGTPNIDQTLLNLVAGTNMTITDNGDGSVTFDATGGSGAVDSVNGQTGVVVLDADDIDDTSTTNKFVTSSDLTKLSNLSGTNTGDQTITNSSDATSHTVTLSASGGSIQLIEGTNITLTTGGTAGAGTVTIAATGGSGTVTSVDMSVPTGLAISGNPVTTSGTLALALDTGYVIPLQTTLDGYVPYTGATADVDLGLFSLQVTNFTAGGTLSVGNVVSDLTPQTDGAVSLGSSALRYSTVATNSLAFDSNLGITADTVLDDVSVETLTFSLLNNVSALKAIFDTSSIATTDKTFTLPNATGTIALTSDITGTNSGTNTGDQSIFQTIAVSGQSNVVADTTTDTLTLVAGTNVTITTDAGADSITINATGGGLTWSEVTGTSQSAAVDTGYIANNAGLVTVTLPTTAAVGKIVRVAGKGAGLWRIAQNASEQIHFGSSSTTVGVGGYIEATNRRDAVELICVVADTEWSVLSSIGNITIV